MDRTSRPWWARLAGPRAKWLVIAAWLVAAVALGPLQPRLQEATVNDPVVFLPSDAESTRVVELLGERFESGRTAPALVVYRNAAGLTAEDEAAIAEDVEAFADVPGAQAVVSPLDEDAEEAGLRSPDGSVAVAVVPLDATTIERIEPAVGELREITGERGGDGLESWVTGGAGVSVDAVEVFGSIDATLLVATTVLILVLLLLIYRSPAVALVPLVVVALAYVVAAGIVYALVSRAGLDVNGQATGILVILMFGAGTDYCLLIVSRFREELARVEDKHAAIEAALTHTSPAILSSGGTTSLALLTLLVADLGSIRSAGPVLALGIAVTMLAGLTLLPALLAALGRRSFWPAIPRVGAEERRRPGIWRRIGDVVARRPGVALTVTVAALALASLGNLVSLPGLSLASGFRATPESVEGFRALEEALPAGAAATTDVLVESDPARVDEASGAVAAALAGVPGVEAVRPGERSEDGRIARLSVTLASDPYGDEAVDAIPELREGAREAAGEGATALVGGATAEEADGRAAASRDASLVVPLTLLVVLLILVALLRALVAPLYLVASVVLSFAATLGLTYALLEYVFDAPGTDASLPIFVFVFVVALGVDYNIFLVARIREETRRHGAREGVLRGLERTGGVITSAGLILAGTFAVLMTLPLEQLFQLGFAVAIGILVDTFVVRTLVVPAIALLLGRWSWWPGRLGRA
ncbi:MAG TPA: MMPL family transporter [Gaiellaceae bacterium]|nr:MMPL family transporter [Gaiellaceae bacterium]